MRNNTWSSSEVQQYFEDRLGVPLKPNSKGEALARCPFHDDRKPSLSANVEKGAWLCHGCGAKGRMLDFEVKRCRVDRAEAERRIAAFSEQQPVAATSPEATYDYVDEQGTLLYQVVRLPRKHFYQRRRDGRGGWLYSLAGVRRVPYRLQELLRAAEVFIVEGEKDVETLRANGLTATCNAMGAGKWQPEWAEFFRGKDVAILPDNDDPGRRHAQQVAASLKPVATSVRILELPGLPEHGDVSDWLDDPLNTIDDLHHLVAAAPVWTPAEEPRVGLSRIPCVWDCEPRPITWAIRGLVPMGCVTLLAGQPGVYKTWLALALCKAVVTGGHFLGRPASPCEVIYCDRENPLSVVQRRIEDLAFERNENLHYWGFHCEEEPALLTGSAPYVEWVRGMRTPPLVVFDSLVRFHSAENENAASEMARVMAELRRVAAAGAAVLVLHHTVKSDSARYRGSSDIQAAVDLSLSLERAASNLQLSTTKNRLGEDFSITMKFDLSAGGFQAIEDPAREKARRDWATVRSFVNENPGKCQREIIEGLRGSGISMGPIREILEQGVGSYWRKETGANNRMEYYPLGQGEVRTQ